MAATSNIQEFTLGVRRDTEQTIDEHHDLVRAVGLQGLSNIVLATRVDTGRARGNWQVQEGAPPEGYDPNLGATVGREDPRGPKRREDPIARGSREILTADGEHVIWIHNGVPYIEILEGKDKMLEGTYQMLQTWLDSQR